MKTEMTIAKALKHKNRVAERIRNLSADISSNNSVLAINEPEVDVLKLEDARTVLVSHLVDVKTAIHRASDPVRDKIFDVSEMRVAINFYRTLDTQHGKRHQRYSMGDEILDYKAVIRKEGVDRRIMVLEAGIDEIQDALEEFNATHRIEVSIPSVMRMQS